ncbi:protein of unknown function (DUF3842) [Carboxydocella thermautotrophica]|nr:protein of unknown function (DUF3842) [Carboxydocella thermautotrophica]
MAFFIFQGGCCSITRIKRIAVLDGQGGGIGKVITEKIRKEFKDSLEIWVFGTNAEATAQMLKAGADDGATGENAIVMNMDKVDLIITSLSLLIPSALMGEVTPKIAEAVASARARKLVLPLLRSNIQLVGIKHEPLPHLIADVITWLKENNQN